MAANGSTPGDAPPQIIDIEAVGAIAVLFENLSLKPNSSASGQAPLSSASILDASLTFSFIDLNIFLFQDLLTADSKGMSFF